MTEAARFDTLEQTVGQVVKDLKDLRDTALARIASGRGSTGDIEPTLRSTAPSGALLLQGATVSRTTYAGLWAWAQDQGLVISGLFTGGDGSTTFGLPDFRGRVVVGVGTLGTDTYTLGQKFGEARHVLTVAETAQHNHGLNEGVTAINVPGGSFQILVPLASGGSTDFEGSSAAHENRPPSIALNWIIWT